MEWINLEHDSDQWREVTAATRSNSFLVLGFLYPEDGGDKVLQNVCSHKIYTAFFRRGITLMRGKTEKISIFLTYEENTFEFVTPTYTS
jgi:hypothetical protein